MSLEFIKHERHNSIAIVSLNRPEKFNALSHEMIVALSDTFTNLEPDAELRAVILTGAGDKAFCAGTDISELIGLDEGAAEEVSQARPVTL